MASTLLMVEPNDFGFNEETSGSNSFQKKSEKNDSKEKALLEFENAIALLRKNGIHVISFPSPKNFKCPDAVFPNNWFSTHQSGQLVIYSMLTLNRRAERNPLIIDYLKNNFEVSEIIDLSTNESENKILEGTGSIVFDHENKLAYACISPRTNENLLDELCKKLNYTPIVFEALDLNGNQIYHTNVVMAIGKKYFVICLDCIENTLEKSMIRQKIKESGKELIEISISQMNSFAGNMLEVQNSAEKSILVMSTTAYNSLSTSQIKILSNYSQLLPIDIKTIETIGGGSARCMMAEIYFSSKIP
jgi:hypothetical protein